LGATLTAYFFGTIATAIKTFAWWFNQFPVIAAWPFMAKWAISASMAGCEYAPLTKAMQTANAHGVHLGLMTAYMEAADNFLRMMQQLALGDKLSWYDWVAALGLGLCVGWQGYMHYRTDQKKQADEAKGIVEAKPVEVQISAPKRKFLRIVFWTVIFVIVASGSICGSLFGGSTGQAYVLATLATGAKTFAWWINQYPQLRGRSFYFKWLAGWSIAAFIEYLPLIGAFQIASSHHVHLGLMTAYMEALDNFFRICQQKLLEKPLAWYDLVSALGMFIAVLFQGILHFVEESSV